MKGFPIFMNALTYEFIEAKRNDLPLNIHKVKKNESAEGCIFHWHKEMEFYYVISGGVKLLYNGKSEVITENKVALVNKYSPHKSLGFLPETEYYIIHIDLEHKIFSGIKTLFYITDLIEGEELTVFLNPLLEEYNNGSMESSYRCIAIIYQLYAQLHEKNSDHKKTLYDNHQLNTCLNVLSFIHEKYTEKITIPLLAHHVNLSSEHLCRIFKKCTGLTITEYVNTVRCTSAMGFLEEGISVMEVAELVGFADYNYFSRTFKKIIGHAPSKYNNHNSIERTNQFRY